MRLERLDEPVKVRADFQGGQVRPLRIGRRHQDLEVAQVTARWEDRRGTQKIYYFSVQVPSGDVYQLEFASGDLLWTLNTVMLD